MMDGEPLHERHQTGKLFLCEPQKTCRNSFNRNSHKVVLISGRTIKRELEHLVEVRPTRLVRTAFEIIDYFKCEIYEKIYCAIFGAPTLTMRKLGAPIDSSSAAVHRMCAWHVPAHAVAQ